MVIRVIRDISVSRVIMGIRLLGLSGSLGYTWIGA